MVASYNKKILGIAIVAVMVVVAISAYILILPTSYPPPCVPKSFGTNLGFENGSMSGWTVPGYDGVISVVDNKAHSGRYSAHIDFSSKFQAEFYQNWKVNPSCQIAFESYVLVICPSGTGWNIGGAAGIVLRERDSVELYVSSGPCGSTQQDQGIVQLALTIDNEVSYWKTGFPFTSNSWYKLGLTIQPGLLRFFVNDQLLHIENRTITIANPSFGAKVGVDSAAYFDDFTMGQRNLSSSMSLSAIPHTGVLNDGNPFVVALYVPWQYRLFCKEKPK